MTAHPLVKFNDHKEDWTERQIGLVAHPLLLIWGNEEGEKYDEYRVLVPAEVWCADAYSKDVEDVHSPHTTW